jgi:hypothetical protein
VGGQVKHHFSMTIPNPRNWDDELEIEVSCEVVDNGIGAYEYWGAKGTHRQLDLEWQLELCPIPDEEIYDNDKICSIIQDEAEKEWEGINEDCA